MDPRPSRSFLVVVVVVVLFACIWGTPACHERGVSKRGGDSATPDAADRQVHIIQSSAVADQSDLLGGKPSEGFGNAGDLAVWYADVGPDVLLTFRSRDTVILNVDVNQNGEPDSNDVSYAVLDGDTPCVQPLHEATFSSDCGRVATAAKVSTRVVGTEIYTAWDIPKRELAPYGGDPMVSLQLFSAADQKSTYYPAPPFSQLCKLAEGKQAPLGGGNPPPKPPEVAEKKKPPVHGEAGVPRAGVAPPPQLQVGREPVAKTIEPPMTNRMEPGRPPGMPPGPPYTMTLSANGSRIVEGCTYSQDDSRFATGDSVILTLSYKGAVPNQTEFFVAWYRNQVPVSYFHYQPTQTNGNWSKQYDNKEVAPGSYRVVLQVDGNEAAQLKFDIGPKAAPCAQ